MDIDTSLRPELQIILLPPIYQPLTEDGREIRLEALHYSYVWAIPKFDLVEDLVDRKLTSSVFPDQDQNSQNFCWTLDLYPRGINDTFRDYLSMNVVCHNPYKKSIEAICRFYIVNHRHEEVYESKYALEYTESGEYSIGAFFRKDILAAQKQTLLPDNILTIRCRIKAFLRTTEDPSLRRDRGSTLCEDIKKLMTDTRFSDYKLIAGNRVFQIHKNILAARSSYFSFMFENHSDELGINEAEITDVRPDVFGELLRFMYTDEVQNIKAIARELLVASELYGVLGCKNMCEKVLAKGLNAENALDLLVLSHNQQAEYLKEACLRCVFNNAHAVVNQPNYRAMQQRHAHLLGHVFARLATWATLE